MFRERWRFASLEWFYGPMILSITTDPVVGVDLERKAALPFIFGKPVRGTTEVYCMAAYDD